MINLKSILEESEWNSSKGFGYQKSKLTFDEVLVILYRLSEADKDAKRYRWMRDKGLLGEVGDAMDSALDVAMQSETDATR